MFRCPILDKADLFHEQWLGLAFKNNALCLEGYIQIMIYQALETEDGRHMTINH